MHANLKTLNKQIAETTGPCRALDALISTSLPTAQAGEPKENYTSSVDACLRLIGAVLPNWHWHVGHGPTGILPYVTLSSTAMEADYRVEATAPTVPLALLHATTKAMILMEQLSGQTAHTANGGHKVTRPASAKKTTPKPQAK
ncbi:MAG: hypothetical protein GY948_03065 [Alphaproteobacteria bacterium]|nr:hypothetical protein [Alphaproteobacteria bacterium]